MDEITDQPISFKERLRLFLELCSLDMKQRTAGTALGYVWLYINPMISIAVIWFVFHFGLKSTAGTDSTYSLLVGLMCWQFLLDAIISGTGAVTEKPYLVKKIKFPLIFLPLIKIANCFRIHIPFLLLILVMSISSGHFSWTRFALFIAVLPAILFFLTSVVLFFSTAVVFYRDLQNIIGIALQFIFWMTPIIWVIPENPKLIGTIESFNPIYFIVHFYRYCFLGSNQDIFLSAVTFFIYLTVVSFLALKIFTKLKDQFADVL